VIVISHPTANQNVRQSALALAEAGLLEEFWTCVNWNDEGFFGRNLPLPSRIRKELQRRSFPGELRPFIRTYPWREWGRLLSGQLGLRWTTRDENSPFSMDTVYHSLDREVAGHLSSQRRAKAIYAYDNGALESFRVAKDLGIKCIYEHPIAYWRTVREYQRQEAELHPEWVATLGALDDSEEKLARKDEELAWADVVITPSTFSAESLKNAPTLKAPVQIIAYGAPRIRSSVEKEESGNRLRVLYVGALSQAKGLGYLLQAVSRLEHHVQLTLIGHRISATIPEQRVLDCHRWIPSLPHDKMLTEMSRHDVLVLPSLHEGFGLVMLEAMAQSVVVITTPHTAGPDLIDDGVDGFIVPIRSSEAIEARLTRLISDRKLLVDMKMAGRRKAEKHSWEIYRQEFASMARALIQ
jgi:alpha-maltose-1-phosphate synthase